MDVLENEVVDDYEKALDDLTCNSKPHINMLTMLAEEKKQYATKIVQIIESRIYQVPVNQKLPILYLIDSVVKNCPDTIYKDCFAKNLIKTFSHVFEKGDEKVRGALFKLRQTWLSFFPASKLYGIDINVHRIDPAWPLVDPSKLSKPTSASADAAKSAAPTTPTPAPNKQVTSIHLNPKFLGTDVFQSKQLAAAAQNESNKQQQQPRTQYERTQKEIQNFNVRPVNQSFIEAINAPSTSRDPRIRNAAQKRVDEDSRPKIPASAADSNNTQRKVYPPTSTPKTPPTQQKPVSVVAKVSPSVRVSLEPSPHCNKTTPPTSADSKIGKLPTTGRETSSRTSVLEKDKDKRNNNNNEFVSSAYVGKSGVGGNSRSARGRGGQTYSLVRETQNFKQIEPSQKRRRTPAELDEEDDEDEDAEIVDSSPKKYKKQSAQISLMKNNRIGKDSSATSTSFSAAKKPPSAPISYASAAADLDFRNNSTDSDRSGRDVDLRTLPLKKRKPSTSTDGFPLDQVLPTEEPPKSANLSKKRPKSDVDLDEILFGGNEDLDMRHVKTPKSADREKPPKLLKMPTEKNYEGIIPSSSKPRRPPPTTQKPKSASIYTSASSAPPNRPKMRPIPKTAPTKPVFPGKMDRQSLLSTNYPVRRAPNLPNRPNFSGPMDPVPVPDVIPSNNMINVDGTAYEVRYINDLPVIDRGDGLPHRLRFVGVGRDILIDGVRYSLKFDETKEIYIDNQPHKLRFGGPSRELYMGNYPFRGSFGGPPIFATINGVKHEILLCGPQPDVKIDPEPAADLLRYLNPPPTVPVPSHGYNTADQGFYPPPQKPRNVPHQGLLPTPSTPAYPVISAPPPPISVPIPLFSTAVPPPVLPTQLPSLAAGVTPANQPPPTVNVHDLLSKLVNTGIINVPTTAAAPTIPPIVPILPPKEIAPTRIEIDDNLSLRLPDAPANLKEFNVKALKIRYTSIIKALYYMDKIQCSTCGMRFLVGDQQKYSKHLDWHFKQNRLEKVPGRSTSRPWYFAAEDWINFEEFADDKTPKAKSDVFENATSQHEETSRFIVASTDSVIIATREDQNECAVCKEKFEQFWDEDEEAWKLRNAMLVDDRAYHPLCYQDASNVERDFGSPGFGSPTSKEKPVFWSVAEPMKTTSTDISFPEIILPSSSINVDEELLMKRNASSKDLLESVLSVVAGDLLVKNDDNLSTAAPIEMPCVKNNFDEKNNFEKNNDSNVATEKKSTNSFLNVNVVNNDRNFDEIDLNFDKITATATRTSSSGGTTPLRDEMPDTPGTPVHDETGVF